MEGLKISIPRRLYYLRIVVTLGLLISFLLSLNLWGGERFFPSIPLFKKITIQPPFDYLLVILSMVFLLCSVLFNHTRPFIFMALVINCFLVMLDLNRLQPWFYVYNAMLVVFLFYNGRVDNPNKFTSIFIYIQLIVGAVYVYNGLSQLMNPYFIATDFYEAVQPLKKIISDRQFDFVLKVGKAVPFVLIFIGIGLLIRQVKYLAISFGLAMHSMLFIFLFPSAGNSNYALWFMNLVFGIMMIFLFSGKTQQRYFSLFGLFQKPVFYMIVAAFWIMPLFNSGNVWPNSLSFNFKSGTSGKENILISENTYRALPYYIKGFCLQKDENYILRVSNWCKHELKSEYFAHDLFVNGGVKEALQIADVQQQLPGDELSIK